jgi:hypothetical protein
LAAVLACAGMGVANAQDFGQEDSPTFWGTGTNFHFISAEEFQASNPEACLWDHHAFGFWGIAECVGGSSVAVMRLPTGSLVTGMTVIYQDDDATDGIQLSLWRKWITSTGILGEEQVGPLFESTGTPGTTATWVDIDPDHTIQYIDGSAAQSYSLLYHENRWSVDLSLRGVIVGWNRQVSPAPVTATFSDVPTGHPFFQFVEALVESGITAGCGGGNYCPDDPVTRGQMAVFLSAALGLHWAP